MYITTTPPTRTLPSLPLLYHPCYRDRKSLTLRRKSCSSSRLAGCCCPPHGIFLHNRPSALSNGAIVCCMLTLTVGQSCLNFFNGSPCNVKGGWEWLCWVAWLYCSFEDGMLEPQGVLIVLIRMLLQRTESKILCFCCWEGALVCCKEWVNGSWRGLQHA